MRSVTLLEPGHFEAKMVADPITLGPEDVLSRVNTIGICGTDYHAYKGDQPFFSYPRRLGHELGVEVLAVGEQVTDLKPGDKCAVEPYLFCGACQPCLAGKTNCCERLNVLGVHVDGGWCEKLILPSQKLHRANDLGFNQLALVETLGIGFHAVGRASLYAGQSILVIGAGPIGMTVMQAAKLRGVRVVAYDYSAHRLEVCKNLRLADEVIVGPQEGLPSVLRTLGGGHLPEVVFDATGQISSMQDCIQYVAFGGTIVFVGLVQNDFSLPDPLFHRKEITLIASRNATSTEFKQILEHMRQKQISVDDWIGPQVSFDDIIDTFPQLLKSQSTFIKAMILL